MKGISEVMQLHTKSMERREWIFALGCANWGQNNICCCKLKMIYLQWKITKKMGVCSERGPSLSSLSGHRKSVHWLFVTNKLALQKDCSSQIQVNKVRQEFPSCSAWMRLKGLPLKEITIIHNWFFANINLKKMTVKPKNKQKQVLMLRWAGKVDILIMRRSWEMWWQQSWCNLELSSAGGGNTPTFSMFLLTLWKFTLNLWTVTNAVQFSEDHKLQRDKLHDRVATQLWRIEK